MLQVGQGIEQPIMSRPPSQHLPEPLDRVELRAVRRQPLALQVRILRQRFVNRLAPVPRRVIKQQHHLGVLLRRVDLGYMPQVVGERLLQAAVLALARFLLCIFGALQGVAVQGRTEQVHHSEDIKQVLAVARPHLGPVSLDPQGRPEGRHHRETGLILAQQDDLPCLRFFWSAAMS